MKGKIFFNPSNFDEIFALTSIIFTSFSILYQTINNHLIYQMIWQYCRNCLFTETLLQGSVGFCLCDKPQLFLITKERPVKCSVKKLILIKFYFSNTVVQVTSISFLTMLSFFFKNHLLMLSATLEFPKPPQTGYFGNFRQFSTILAKQFYDWGNFANCIFEILAIWNICGLLSNKISSK